MILSIWYGLIGVLVAGITLISLTMRPARGAIRFEPRPAKQRHAWWAENLVIVGSGLVWPVTVAAVVVHEIRKRRQAA